MPLNHGLDPDRLVVECFSILSYNTLADYLANNHRSKLYFHIPRRFMDWEWRKKGIVFELGLWSPNTMCFQLKWWATFVKRFATEIVRGHFGKDICS